MEKVFRNKNQPWVFSLKPACSPLSFSTRAAHLALPLHRAEPTTDPAAQSLTRTETRVKVAPTRPGWSRVEANGAVFTLLILSPSIMSWSQI
jgi:hypothetical protein